MTEAPAVTRDGFLRHRLAVDQPAAGAHRSGLDAVLLAAALGPETAGTVVDLGAGVGVAGLSVAVRCPGARVVLVERDPEALGLARSNAVLNAAAVGDRVAVVAADVAAPPAVQEAAGLTRHGAAHVVMNPPFHPADRTRASPTAARAGAHRLDPDDLDAWIRTAVRLLDPRGTLTVVFRADELPRLVAAVAGRFGSPTVLPVHPRADAAATRVLLRARPQGRAPFRLLPPLVLHEPDGAWTAAAEAVLSGAALEARWWG